MRKVLVSVLIAGAMLGLAPRLSAQAVCPGYSIVINTPADELTLAYNGAEKPEEQIAALDKFMSAYGDDKFVPCAEEYYTMTYLKLNDYAKVIEHGEKALALNHRDVMTLLNLAKAYVASGKVSDTAFEAVLSAADPIKSESNPSKPPNVSDDDWKKEVDAAAQQAADWRAYMEYAFFQIIQREPDGNKRLAWLDKYAQAYPESPHAGKLNFQYFLAYKMAGNADKAMEYGEKAVATDPTNVVAANLFAYDLVFVKRDADRASELAKKALDLASGMKKAEGASDEQFKNDQDSQMGMAHLTLGYAGYVKAEKTKKVGPAIEDLKMAGDLLHANTALQAQALYLLGNAYEFEYPPNHKGALDVLTRAAALASPWQAQSQDLLGKVKKAAKQ